MRVVIYNENLGRRGRREGGTAEGGREVGKQKEEEEEEEEEEEVVCLGEVALVVVVREVKRISDA